ncbi:MAG: FlgD immunoglobulin-like domain containing protein, partial [Candidatus Eisenbacteria bacterium]|nr:FlgD immunoglobulin-like domain containing protein [Candidatus Eisenbacteria bacterium]
SEHYGVDFVSAALRGIENEDLDARLDGYESNGGIPTVFRLIQNSPNPFNPVTRVAYNVPHESHVAVHVYDVSGRVVRTLVDGSKEPGRHVAVWDGRNDQGESCGSGVYFCVMETPEYRGSHKMMLLK